MLRAVMIVAATLFLVAPGDARERGVSMRELAVVAARQHGVDPAIVLSVGEQESEHQNIRRKGHPEIGPMQIMPGTWDDQKCQGDIWIARDNYNCGAKYLKNRLDNYRGVTCLAVQAYKDGRARRPCGRKGSYAWHVLARIQQWNMQAVVRGEPRLIAKQGG